MSTRLSLWAAGVFAVTLLHSRAAPAAPPALERLNIGIKRAHGYADPPPLTVEVSADSPDAAGRYLWMARHIPASLQELDPWLDTERYAIFSDESHHLTIADAERAFEDNQDWFRDFQAASRIPTATFCFDAGLRTLGYSTGDPRDRVLTRLRSLHRLALFEARRRWEAKDPSGACEMVEADLRYANHLGGQQGSLIEELVAQAVLDSALLHIEQWSDAGMDIPPDRAATLASLLDRLDAADPTGLRASCDTYRVGMLAFARDQLAEGQDPVDLRFDLMQARAMDRLADALFGDLLKLSTGEGNADDLFSISWREAAESLWGLLLDYAAMHRANLRRSLATCEQLSRDIASHWDSPEFKQWFDTTIGSLPDDHSGMRSLAGIEIAGTIHRHILEERSTISRVRGILLDRAARQPDAK